MAVVTGKTELAKQVARYMHKDIKKVCHVTSHTHTDTRTHQCFNIQSIGGGKKGLLIDIKHTDI